VRATGKTGRDHPRPVMRMFGGFGHNAVGAFFDEFSRLTSRIAEILTQKYFRVKDRECSCTKFSQEMTIVRNQIRCLLPLCESANKGIPFFTESQSDVLGN
jgi:hypothetical protein